jgi:microsomal dipeptidase-like Zn-dependent dipeptidase
MSTLHQDSIVIDGLIIAKLDRSVFEDMQKGGLAAANCTVSVWDDFPKTVDNIATLKQLIRDNSDLVTLARNTADIVNKSDAELKFIADHGGFIGVTMFSPFLKRGNASTVHDYVEAIDYVINIVGEDCVGLGSDFTQGHGHEFFDMLTHDKGRWRRLTTFGEVINPEGIRTIGDFPNLTATMQQTGWSDTRITKVLGANWMKFFDQVWGT